MSERDPIKSSPTENPRPRRSRKTKKSVLVQNSLAKWVITTAGIGTITAVSIVCIFLVYVVEPLWHPIELGPQSRVPAAATQATDFDNLMVIVDEQKCSMGQLAPSGKWSISSLKSGETIKEIDPWPNQKIISFQENPGAKKIAVALDSGAVFLAEPSFSEQFLKESPSRACDDLKPGDNLVLDGKLIRRTDFGQLVSLEFDLSVEEFLPAGERKITNIACVERGEEDWIAYQAENELHMIRKTSEMDMFSGEEVSSLEQHTLQTEPNAANKQLVSMLLPDLGRQLFLLYSDGLYQRYELSSWGEEKLLENKQLPKKGEILHAKFLAGRSTIILGDSAGEIQALFLCRPEGSTTEDGQELVKAHEFKLADTAITAIACSSTERVVAVTTADDQMHFLQISTDRILKQTKSQEAVNLLSFFPSTDGLIVQSDKQLSVYDLDLGHSEASLGGLLGKSWYEGYPQPLFMWQSSSASDNTEAKLSMMPLIFGTLKGAFYSLLFAAPLALLAAIYSSEFLKPKTKGYVKTIIEFMASLPSVVLGFLAALVFAPYLETVLLSGLMCLFTVPLLLLLASQLWQMIPQKIAGRIAPIKLVAIFATLILGVFFSSIAAGLVEGALFETGFKQWLSVREGSAFGGWLLICSPIAFIVAIGLAQRFMKPLLLDSPFAQTRFGLAVADLGLYVLSVAAAVLVSMGIAWMLTQGSFDPRPHIVGTYIQRNALIVGIFMGIAIIPIMYTIAEDALSSVPNHLRAASLGAGATRWQTAIRIVIPTAVSGLFSALMIGIGRGVGETMIVLMAAGNTAVMDINLFNGFRTLAANLAVELPEAVRDSTHYRTLFLAALVLFIMTFILNTAAELVRMRFRKKAFEL